MNDRKNRTPDSIGRENLVRLAATAAFITLTACGGGGSETDGSNLDLSNLQSVPPELAAAQASLNAEIDVVESVAGDVVTVSILQNDSFNGSAQLQLIGQPANGTATLLENGDVEYVADIDFEGTDTVSYVLVDENGQTSEGTLYIAVVCAECSTGNIAATSASGAPFCINPAADADGDGYGWENNTTCEVREPQLGAAQGPLTATSDSLSIEAGTVKTVSPLRNDTIADRSTVQFAIDVLPQEGRIEAVDTGIIVYAAPANFSGTDSLVYSIKDSNGATSVASIDFDISCATCDVKDGLRLTWPSNPESEGVEGYRIFFGPDENTHTASLLTEVSAATFNGDSPNAVFDIVNDLNLSGSEGGCFRVQAYRGAEESEHSDAVCFSLG